MLFLLLYQFLKSRSVSVPFMGSSDTVLYQRHFPYLRTGAYQSTQYSEVEQHQKQRCAP